MTSKIVELISRRKNNIRASCIGWMVMLWRENSREQVNFFLPGTTQWQIQKDSRQPNKLQKLSQNKTALWFNPKPAHTSPLHFPSSPSSNICVPWYIFTWGKQRLHSLFYRLKILVPKERKDTSTSMTKGSRKNTFCVPRAPNWWERRQWASMFKLNPWISLKQEIGRLFHSRKVYDLQIIPFVMVKYVTIKIVIQMNVVDVFLHRTESYMRNWLTDRTVYRGVQIYWLVLGQVTRNIKKVLILSEKEHKNVTLSMYCTSITYVKLVFLVMWLVGANPVTNQRRVFISSCDMLACSNAAVERTQQQYVSSSVACENQERTVMAYYPYYPSRMRDFRVSSLLEGCSQFIPGIPGSNPSMPNNFNSNASYVYPPYHPQQLTKQSSHFGPASAIAATPHPSSQQVRMPGQESELESAELSLENKDLWTNFFKEKTEMVITKAGR